MHAEFKNELEEKTMLKRLIAEEEGQTLVEYGLLISLIALVVIAVLTLMGNKIKNTFNAAGNQLTS
jgi:pilus assembly protein Flp/PilA